MIVAFLLLGAVLTPSPPSEEAVQRHVAQCISLSMRDVGAATVDCAAAASEAQQLGNRELEATALAYRAGCLSWTAEWSEGLRDGYRALELAGPSAASLASRHASLVLGAIHRERGEARLALQHLQKAIEKSDQADDRMNGSLAHSVLARTLFWLGDFQRARAETDRARQLAAHEPYAEFFAAWQRGMTELESRNLDAATTYLNAALTNAQAIAFGAGVANMQVNIADLSVQSGNFAGAVVALNAARLLIQRQQAPALFGPYLDETEGRLLAARGQHQLAAARFERATRGASPWLQARALVGRARALRDQSLGADAVAAYRRAIDAVEATRADTPADGQRATYMAANLAPYRELVALLWATGGPALAEQAFEVSEAARARALRDAVAAAGHSSQVARPVTVAALQARLTGSDLFIEYLQTDRQLFAFAVSKSMVRWIAVADATEERAQFLHQLVQQEGPTANLEPVSRRLFDDLLAPVLTGLSSDVTNVIISADGALQLLPFELLRRGDGGSTRPAALMVNEFVVHYSPSAALLFRDREASTSPSMLAVSAPLTPPIDDALARWTSGTPAPLRPLPFSRVEVETAFRHASGTGLLLTGAAARESAVKRAALSGFGRLHFATHAIVNSAVPQHSALMLGSGDGEDGMLEASEIYALTLKAELVVLSACDTAVGPLLGGEGTQSLGRAFLQAGAQRVISTLWPIEDRQSVVFMSRFYDALDEGAAPARALTEAKRVSLADGMPARVWAAFVLTGALDPARSTPTVASGGRFRQAAAVIAGLVMLSWLWYAQRRANHGAAA